MTSSNLPERRQTARVDLHGQVECHLELQARVQVLDISLSGAMLGGGLQLPIGAPAHLRSGLASRLFEADVEIRRVAQLDPQGKAGLGTIFSAMNDQSRRSLEDFVRKARV